MATAKRLYNASNAVAVIDWIVGLGGVVRKVRGTDSIEINPQSPDRMTVLPHEFVVSLPGGKWDVESAITRRYQYGTSDDQGRLRANRRG